MSNTRIPAGTIIRIPAGVKFYTGWYGVGGYRDIYVTVPELPDLSQWNTLTEYVDAVVVLPSSGMELIDRSGVELTSITRVRFMHEVNYTPVASPSRPDGGPMNWYYDERDPVANEVYIYADPSDRTSVRLFGGSKQAGSSGGSGAMVAVGLVGAAVIVALLASSKD